MQHKFPEEFFHTKNTETKEKVYDILYVGEDKSVIEALSSNDEINLTCIIHKNKQNDVNIL